MKKLITALMILAALFCFTACQPEADPTPAPAPDPTPTPAPTPTLDTTTLDGYYVVTQAVSGKPANSETVVISGNTVSCYELTWNDLPTSAELDAAAQELWDVDTIVCDGLTFTVTENNSYYFHSDVTYKLITENGETWLCSLEDDGEIDEKLYQKVVPGTTGTPQVTGDMYLTTDHSCDLSIGTAVYNSINVMVSILNTETDWYDGSSMANIQTNANGFTFDCGEDGAFTVTYTATGVDMAYTGDLANMGLPTSLTKYVRATAWPVVPAN